MRSILLKSELGLTPMNDGKLIRIVLPTLTEERRRELVKVVKRMGEDFKVQIRNHRRDANEMLKEMKKEKEIGEDEMRKGQERVQKTTDDNISKVDAIAISHSLLRARRLNKRYPKSASPNASDPIPISGIRKKNTSR